MLKILKKNYSLRVKCPNLAFFLVRIFLHADWIRRDTPYLDTFQAAIFVKLPLVANSEPRVILFFSWNLAYLSLDAVVLQFLKNSSSVFFKGFQTVSNLSFLQFRISCFLERPLSGSIFDRFDLCCSLLYVVCFTCAQFQKK